MSEGVWRPWVLLAVAPLLEEIVCRWGMQDALMRRWPERDKAAVVLVALAFAIVHALVRQDAVALLLALPALALGAVYRRTGQLAHCVAVHAGMNAVWLLGAGGWWSRWTTGV